MKPLENIGKTSVLLHPSHVIGTPPFGLDAVNRELQRLKEPEVGKTAIILRTTERHSIP
jgi:hypothetical protein